MSDFQPLGRMSTQLPHAAAFELFRASTAPMHMREGAIDRATIRVKQRYPQLFKREEQQA